MPAEPSHHAPDDGQLPNDLLALGEQLRDDAAWLASRYPAGKFANSSPPLSLSSDHSDPGPMRSRSASTTRRRFQRLRRIAWTAIALTTAIVALVWLPTGMDRSQPEMPTAESTTENNLIDHSKTSRSQPRRTIAAHSEPAESNLPAESNRQHEAGPALLLHDMSGPELEGLLDLLRYESTETSGLSI